MDNFTKVVEWVGSVLGLIGAAVLCLSAGSDATLAGMGFVAFLFSNACWIWVGYKQQSRPMLVMQAMFTATSVVGISRLLF